MPFWRRDEPVHKKLAKALMNAQGGAYLAHPPDLEGNPTTAEVALHGVPRPRRWDAVVTVDAELPGETVHFVALPDGTLLVDEDVPDGALVPLADALEEELPRPYRAEGTKRGPDLWAVAASQIEVVRVPEEVDGDTVELAVRDGERTLLVDGMRAFGTVPSLETLGDGRSAYVIRGARLDEDLWEVTVSPL